jgi:hypothetical protein
MSIDERLRAGAAGEASGAGLERALDQVWQRRRASTRRRVVGTVMAGAAAAVAVLVAGPYAVEQLSDREPLGPPSGDLVGTYRVQISQAEDADLAGTWRITLDTAGALTAQPPSSFDSGPLNPGGYETVDGVVETNLFVHLPGCQVPGALVGRYRWSTHDETVTFSRLDDACEPRRVLFSAPWEKIR